MPGGQQGGGRYLEIWTLLLFLRVKVHPRQTAADTNTANATSAQYKHLHSQHANTKVSKTPK